MSRGKLIVFEGLDKSGKTTLIQEILKAKNNDYVYSKGLSKDSLIGKLSHAYPSGPLFYAVLFYDSITRIMPALKNGKIILQDRYLYSIAAFSGSRLNKLRWFHSILFPRPDLFLYLFVSKEERLKRLSKDLGNKYHSELYKNPSLIDQREMSYLKLYQSFKGNKIMIDTTSESEQIIAQKLSRMI